MLHPERSIKHIVRKILTIRVFKLHFFLYDRFCFNLFNMIHCLYIINHLEGRICHKLWCKCLQLFSRPKSPGHTYCIYLRCLSCFHICVGISQIQTLLFFKSQLLYQSHYTVRCRLFFDALRFSFSVYLIKRIISKNIGYIIKSSLVWLI